MVGLFVFVVFVEDGIFEGEESVIGSEEMKLLM